MLAVALPILITLLLMRVFTYLPSHPARGLGMGIGFVGGQFARAAVAHVWLTPLQIAGALLATVGMFLLSMPARRAVTPVEARNVADV